MDHEFKEEKDDYLRLIGELSSGIFHEIRTPLQYIDNNIRYLEDTYRLFQKRKEDESNNIQLLDEFPEVLEDLKEGVGRISDLLSALKILSRRQYSDKSFFNIGSAWDEAVKISIGEWKNRVVIEKKSEMDEFCINGIKPLIIHVFINLIINAAQAMDEKKGHLTAGLSIDNEKLIISICDNGPGVDTDLKEKIFEPFYTTKSPGKGSGQGLAFVRRVITDVHNGKIVCVDNKSGGTCFRIILSDFKTEDSQQ